MSIQRLTMWMRGHVFAVDTVIASCLYVVGSVVAWLMLQTPAHTPTLGELLLYFGVPALMALGLCWRRTRPDAAGLAVVGLHAAQAAASTVVLPINVAGPMAFYTVAALGKQRFQPLWLTAACLSGPVVGVLWQKSQLAAGWSWKTFVGASLFVSVSLCVSWVLGRVQRAKRKIELASIDQAAAALREQARLNEVNIGTERRRIARDVHDVVAHSLSVIIVQAEGAAFMARHGQQPPTERLQLAQETLRKIHAIAQSTAAQTHSLLEADTPMSLADIDQLVSALEQAGYRVDYSIDLGARTPRQLGTDAVQQAVYRICQEAVTNIMKHAGPEAAVTISLAVRDQELTMQVADNGQGPAAADGSGSGLAGMAERARAVGGHVTTSAPDSGGFVVACTVPVEAN